jgi:DHA3 family macrolide efflux protein-like MFS transporter
MAQADDAVRPIVGSKPNAWFKRFLGIWSGQAASLIGSQLVQFALVWWLTIQTGSATVLAIASIAAIVPQIILSPFAGAYVDRWKRRHVMIAADGLIAVSTMVLIFLFVIGTTPVWSIIIIVLVRSCFSAFHWPASQAATTMLVPEEHLTRVAGMNQTLQGMAGIVAPPLAAVLLAIMPIEMVLSVDIITAVLAIIPLLVIRFPEPQVQGLKRKVTADLKEGLRFMRQWKGAMALVMVFTVVNMLISPAFSLVPILVVNHFHGGAIDLAWLEAAVGIGIILGGIVLSIWGGTERRIVTVAASIALAGIGVTLFAMVPSNGFLIALALLLYIGVMLSLINGSVNALMQASVPINMQGRVFALIGAVAMGASPIGLAFAGPVADQIGIMPWFVIAGVPTIILGTVIFFLPSVMHIEEKGSLPPVDDTIATKKEVAVIEGED